MSKNGQIPVLWKSKASMSYIRFQFYFQSDDTWKEMSTMNNLNDVYQLHCNGEPLQKDTRDVFVKGSIQDVREKFQVIYYSFVNHVTETLNIYFYCIV
jgi:hypothetical protein